ncbi:MAG: YhdP family protein [Gammaproteobacteria bacterium]|nr:YhdP family protein [Gammaproteobacteria bacterium]
MRTLRYRLHAVLHQLLAASHITLRHTWKMAIGATAVIIIMAGVMLGAVRLLSPMLGEFRGDIEAWASVSVGQPVKIGGVEADWSGWLPLIKLTDVRVYTTQGERVLLRLGNTLLRVDPLSYLRHRRIEPSHLVLVGVDLSLIRTPQGHIVLEGFEDGDLSGDAFVQWLLRQGRLEVRHSRIDWTDQETGKARRRFSDVSFLLRTDGQRHQLTGELDLPGAQPGYVMLALDFGGDLATPASLGGKVYLQSKDVDLVQAQELLQWAGMVVPQGIIDFMLWGEWSDARLQRLEGEAVARSVRLAVADKPVLEIRRVSTQLQWQRETYGWALAAENFVIERDRAAPAIRLAIVSSRAADGAPVLDARASEWRIEDAAALLLATDTAEEVLRAPLTRMQPQGVLHDVRVRFAPQSSGGSPENFYLRARVESVRTHAFQSLPGLDNVSGILECDTDSGSLKIDTQQGQVVFDHLRKPVVIKHATGMLGWVRTDQGWRAGFRDVELNNDDLRVHASGVIEWPHDGSSPSINLQSDFASPNIGRLPDYLPDALPEQARSWLARALVTGRINSGSAVVRGRLSDFPFEGGSGVAEARMALSGAVLDYEPGWPWLGDIEGEVIIRGRSLEVNVASGKILDSEVKKVSAKIPDMTLEEPLLTVQGAARGAAPDVLRLLRESPLKNTVAGYVAGVSARGETTLDLELLIPLSLQPNQIKGGLTFKEGALRYADKPRERDVELTHINGTLSFNSDYHLSGNNIDANLYGQKVKLALRTEVPTVAGRASQLLAIEARGKTDVAGIVRQLQQVAPDMQARTLDWLSGSTDWVGTLYLKASDDGNASFDSEWRLVSSLRGMALKLPDPLGKPEAEAVSFMIESALASTPQNRRINLHYGNGRNGTFEFARVNKAWELARGELYFGVAKATLPPQGLRVSGEVERFALTEWLQFLDGGASRAGSLTGKLNAVDIQVGALEVYGQHFSDIQLRASQTAQAWEANVGSTALAGSLRLTREKEAMLVMKLERLHLGKIAEGGATKGADPRQWPALRVDVANFKYGDADLGQLHLEAARRSLGLRIDSVSLASPDFQINGQGDWVMEQEGLMSRFTAKARADDMGKMLTAFDYDAPVSGGKSQFDLSASWPGSPADFALEHLNGEMDLRATKGRLLDVDPGAGRVFGLLSLQALPRRLTLDFSDLFSKGFSFDRIEGSFVLENGNAYTNNLVMEGPAAKVTVTGRTGLAAKDYDQVVTVQPEISEGLSVGAGLAGGPIVGLSFFLANKLLPGLKDIAAYQYTIKGPWKEPVIAPVEVGKTDTKKTAG